MKNRGAEAPGFLLERKLCFPSLKEEFVGNEQFFCKSAEIYLKNDKLYVHYAESYVIMDSQ